MHRELHPLTSRYRCIKKPLVTLVSYIPWVAGDLHCRKMASNQSKSSLRICWSRPTCVACLLPPQKKKKSNVNNEEREREDHCGSHVPNCHPPNRRTVPTRPNKTKKISPQKKSFLFVSFFISSDKLASRFFFFFASAAKSTSRENGVFI
jgi:hypothetical protein